MKNFDKFLAIAVIAIVISCNASKHGKSPVFVPISTTLPVVIQTPTKQVAKKDTTPKTDNKKIQKYIREQYKLNYDELVSPDLKKLYGIIEKQAIALNGMSSYMDETRRRMDSIVRERNYYRLGNEKRDSAYQSTIVELNRKQLDNQKKFNEENAGQIKINRILAIACLIGFVILVIVIVALWYRVNKLYEKFVKNA